MNEHEKNREKGEGGDRCENDKRKRGRNKKKKKKKENGAERIYIYILYKIRKYGARKEKG